MHEPAAPLPLTCRSSPNRLAARGSQQRHDHVADRRRDAVPGAQPLDHAVAGVPFERAAGLVVEEDRGAEVLRDRRRTRRRARRRPRPAGRRPRRAPRPASRRPGRGASAATSGRRNMPARRPASTIRPATALMASLRHASVVKSPVSSTPSIRPATTAASGSSGSVSRRSPRTRTWPGRDAFDRHPHDGRQDGRVAHVRRDELALLDPVLEHDHHRPGAAQRAQEGRRALGLMRLDGQQHDVGGPAPLAGVGEHRAGHDLGAAALALDDEALVRRAAVQGELGAARRTAATVAPIAPGPTTATQRHAAAGAASSAGPSRSRSSARRPASRPAIL